MRIWYLAAFLLIACGGKIATESTGTTSGKPIQPIPGDDDDDSPNASSGYPGTSSGYYGTTSGYYSSSGYGTSGYASSGYASSGYTSSGYTSSGYSSSGYSSSSSGYSSSSSGGTVCKDINVGCGGDTQSYKCSISGQSGPGLVCYGNSGEPVVKCECTGADAGNNSFELKITKYPELKDVVNAWKKYCGGTCN